jgi:anhydro-N-acetylmuramic acid kinase
MIPIIGLMSGTSMDGINATIIETDGKKLNRTNINTIYKYQHQTKTLLLNAIKNTSQFLNNIKQQEVLNKLISIDHAKAVNLTKLKYSSKPEFIGFHGQTILHNPKLKTTIQLGDSQLLANLTNIDVISNFRSKDMLNGGQGAPIAPIYHQKIIEELNIELPCCLINIGGVCNLTYWDGNQLIGFDVGPGNGLMDIYSQNILGLPFDKNGQIASNGIVNLEIIKEFKKNIFLYKKYPKSLDRLHFIKFYDMVVDKQLSPNDSLSTLLELTIFAIKTAIKQLPIFPKNLVLMGGGQNNKFLVNKLKRIPYLNCYTSDQLNLPGEMIEAELIGYLAARTLFNLPYTFPKTTGVNKPCCGGIIYKKNKHL